jgi:hypothetical protein
MTEKDITKKSNLGGAREGAGRPKGSKNKISLATSQTVVEMLYDRTGQCYEEILIEDFLKARQTNDALAHKYHALLANKLMPDLQSVEITNPEDAIETRALVFAEALAALSAKSQELKK